MQYLYQKEFDSLSLTNCPPSHYEIKFIQQAFRWVYDEMEDVRNFIPVYFKNPKRFLGKNEKTLCSSLALLLFESEEDAQNRFNELRKVYPDTAYDTFGTNIAVGTITEKDGSNSESDEKGHFSHHPVVNSDYNKQFKIIKKL